MEESEVYPYPQRISQWPLERVLLQLEAIRPWALTLEEKERVLGYERKLGEELENIWAKKVNTLTLYPDFFKTPKGKQILAGLEEEVNEEAMTALLAQEETGEIDKTVKDQPLQQRLFQINWQAVPDKLRREIAGASNDWQIEKLTQEFIANGYSIEDMEEPKRLQLILNPEVAREKIQGYREFKSELKRQNFPETREGKAYKIVKRIYQRRVNALITEGYHWGIMVVAKAEILGEENLSEKEEKLVNLLGGMGRLRERTTRTASRLDKFLRGVTTELSDEGDYRQIDKALLAYADEVEEKREAVLDEETQDRYMKEKWGVSLKQARAKKLDAYKFQGLAKEVLEAYGILSGEDESSWTSERLGRAADEKWQVIVDPRARSLSVYSRQGIIKVPANFERTLVAALPVLAHEVEGHVIQHENKRQIGLKLFEEIGGERGEVFFEGGAMSLQNQVAQELFGKPTISHPYYARAMAERLEGGSYLECFESWFESMKRYLEVRRRVGELSEEDYKKALKNGILTGFDRVKRLFSEGIKFANQEPYLTKSKSLSYLEQEVLTEALRRAGRLDILDLGGINLQTLYDLKRAGLVDLSGLLRRKNVVVEQIWPKMISETRRGRE